MNKAILVIDTPKSCKECKLSSMFGTICPMIGDTYTADGKADDCPLEPIPEKELIWNDGDDYQMGWNDCIDEILGEENE